MSRLPLFPLFLSVHVLMCVSVFLFYFDSFTSYVIVFSFSSTHLIMFKLSQLFPLPFSPLSVFSPLFPSAHCYVVPHVAMKLPSIVPPFVFWALRLGPTPAYHTAHSTLMTQYTWFIPHISIDTNKNNATTVLQIQSLKFISIVTFDCFKITPQVSTPVFSALSSALKTVCNKYEKWWQRATGW